MHWIRHSAAKLRHLIWGQLAKRSPSENAFLLVLPVVGLVVGLTLVGIAHLLAFLQKLFWGSGTYLLDAAESNPWPLRIVIPLMGGVLVGVIGWLFRVQTRGAGTGRMIQAIRLKGGQLSLGETLRWLLAALATIGTGGLLGREGPMMRVAGAIGSRVGRQFRLTPEQLRTLVCAAAASALAAVYNAPIGGSLFALEVLMGNFALDVFGPVVVASVLSTLVFRGAMGNLPRFVVPQYALVSGWELPAYLVLGVIGGGVSLVFGKVLFATEDAFEKLPGPRWIKPVLGFGLLGVLGCFLPHVFGNGYDAVNQALHEQLPLVLLLVLLPAKILATSLTFGSGGAGGLFMPTLMVGALVGGAFGHGVHTLFPVHTAGSGAYALVGMGAIVAGTTHAPITAIMMIFEQTNSYQIVLPLMFVCVVSHFTARLLGGRSLHEAGLARQGVTLPRGPEESVMQTMRVSSVMHEEVQAVNHSLPFVTVVERFLNEPYNNLYVVDSTGRFLGAIRLHALKNMLHQTDALTSVIADDLLDDSFQFVTRDQNLAEVMQVFWHERAERLPVVDNPTDRLLVGWLSKRDLFGVYSQEVLRQRQLLGHFIVNAEYGKRDVFVELPVGFELCTVELPANYDGCTLAQLSLRSHYGVHVIAVRHRDSLTCRDVVEIPGPESRLQAGDWLTAIGKLENMARFQEMLSTAGMSTEEITEGNTARTS